MNCPDCQFSNFGIVSSIFPDEIICEFCGYTEEKQ